MGGGGGGVGGAPASGAPVVPMSVYACRPKLTCAKKVIHTQEKSENKVYWVPTMNNKLLKKSNQGYVAQGHILSNVIKVV